MLRAIGIDLGTSKAVVAALRRGEPEVLLNRDQNPLTPSTLSLSPDGQLLLGRPPGEPDEGRGRPALFSFLRWLGVDTPLPFNGLQYTAWELAAILLARLKEDAEAALGEPVGRAVLAIPVSFGQRQMAALNAAARLAGLFVLRVVHSPVAAALAYSLAHPQMTAHTLLVYDLGGGRLDVAALRLLPGAVTGLGLAGEGWLGGEDLTESIVALLIRRLQGERGLLIDESLVARQQLRYALRLIAERAKEALSTVEHADISVPAALLDGSASIEGVLAREEFEALIRPRLEEALEPVDRALSAAGLPREGVEQILLAGGSTRIPLLQALLAEHLPGARVQRDFNPLVSAALGAAALTGMLGEVQCPVCRRPNPREAQVCERCFSPLAGQPRLTCPRCFLPNEPVRQLCWKCGTALRAVRLEPPIRPLGLLCPRCGAALPAGATSCEACRAPIPQPSPWGLRCPRCGRVAEVGASACVGCGHLVAPFVGDLSTHSLGIEAADGRLDVVLPRGQGFPTAQPASRELRLASAGQRQMDIALYEGEKPLARDNDRLGRLRVTLPEGLAAGDAIRVAFALGPDGVLAAQATLGDGPERALEAWIEWEWRSGVAS